MGHRGEEGGEIIDRIIKSFQCLSIIVAREEHEVKGHHYHIGIKNKNANRKNATSKLRLPRICWGAVTRLFSQVLDFRMPVCVKIRRRGEDS